MEENSEFDVVIIGGGLAGLTVALHLSKINLNLLLIEKQSFPHHKVCGEYVSNEVLPYLKQLGIDPFLKGAVPISKFEISTQKGHKVHSKLPLGGFGISRFTLDHYLCTSVSNQIKIAQKTVESVTFINEMFTVQTLDKFQYTAPFVIGAFGKRSNLDPYLNRSFIQQKSPWLAVKAHYQYTHPTDTVSLHNFEGGYCGISNVENNIVNACYLTTYDSFKKIGNIETFQKEVMSKNPNLRDFFKDAKMVFHKPLTISQVSFERKQPVENHIFMIGDSAGLIHPLCGNGMAMAIHSAKICSELLIKVLKKKEFHRNQAEKEYQKQWQTAFSNRLKTGRMIQNLLLRPTLANAGFSVVKRFPSLVPKIIKKTHGDLFL